MGAISSVQLGSALARTLFDDVGPSGTVMLRVVLGAVVLLALWRPSVRAHPRGDLWLAALFGVVLAGMNFSFYQAIDHIALGPAVTFEFIGPLGVAVAGSRRPLDLFWVALAAGGILLLAAPGGSHLNAAGVSLALLAGAFWAAYILLSARVGRVFPGGRGLALAMVVASVLLVGPGVAQGGSRLLHLDVLGTGLGVGLLSTVIPYSLELEALRRLRAAVFGVLMSLEPAAAALAGLVVLGQVLGLNEWAGMALVIAASVGASRSSRAPVPIDG